MAKSPAEQRTQDWLQSRWRPLMAVTYMVTIWFDFIIGPVIFNVLQFQNVGQAITSWTPLTLQGGGLYHVAMGAILGIAAWTRGKEKVAVIEQGYDTRPREPEWVTPPDYYRNRNNYDYEEPLAYDDDAPPRRRKSY